MKLKKKMEFEDLFSYVMNKVMRDLDFDSAMEFADELVSDDKLKELAKYLDVKKVTYDEDSDSFNIKFKEEI